MNVQTTLKQRIFQQYFNRATTIDKLWIMDRYHIFDFQPALIFFVCLFFLAGCGIGTPLRTKSSFSYCFDGENTGLDSLINIDGFFYMKSKTNENILLNESNIGYFYPSFVFYKKNFVHINPYYDLVFSNPKSSLHNFFDTHTRAEFGSYILNRDTIKCKSLNRQGARHKAFTRFGLKLLTIIISGLFIGEIQIWFRMQL